MYQNNYSPFTKRNGHLKDFFKIDFDDLEQLKTKDIEEGLKIEYKRELSQSVKEKLPKIITSFANEKGGWLFIGIEEDSKDLNLIPNEDYELMINNMIKDLTSPAPKYFIKFLSPSDNNDFGVLVIWIPEGENPPYISQGRTYRRFGSGSSPVKHIEDRFYINELYEKSEKYINDLNSFCEKEISIYNEFWNSHIMQTIKHGMCNLYFIPIINLNLLEIMMPEDLENYIIEESKKLHELSFDGFPEEMDGNITMNVPFYKSQYTNESIVFRNTDIIDLYERTVAWEQFFNGAAKFHIPISYFNNYQEIINKIKTYSSNYNDEKIFMDFEYIDGLNFLVSLIGCIYEYFTFIKEINDNFREVRLVIEFENIRKDVLYFETNTYQSFLQEKGLVFAEKNYYKINRNFNSMKVKNKLINILGYIQDSFNIFGYSKIEAITLLFTAMSKIAEKN